MRRRVPPSQLTLTALCFAVGACNLENAGDAPATGTLYFPSPVGLSSHDDTSAARYLYVANANFDLRYNAGSLQAYDLDVLDAILSGTATAPGCETPGTQCVLSPRAVSESGGTEANLLADEVLIPSFVSDLSVSPTGERVYVVTRGDASLTYVDVDENADGPGLLSCGPSSQRRCDQAHSRGDDSVQNGRKLRFPGEPVAIVSGDAASLVAPSGTALSGDFVMVAHREGQTSLFLEQTEGDEATGPVLVDVLAGLPLEPTGIAFDGAHGLAYLSVYARLTGSQAKAKILARIGVAVDDTAPLLSSLYYADSLVLDGVTDNRDTRAVAITEQGQAYVASRQPSAVLWVDVTEGTNRLRMPAELTVEVGAGPSRLDVGSVGGVPIVVVSCFDARQIFVLDARTGEPLSIVHNLSGPFDLAIDGVRQRLYVADFRSSVIRVIDLSPIVTGASTGPTSARLVATIGKTRLLEEFQ